MAFSVKAEVPPRFKCAAIRELLAEASVGMFASNDVMFDQYAWLLQISSWNYDLNWNVKEDYFEIEIPLSGKLLMVDTSVDFMDLAAGYSVDGVSKMLIQIIESVPVKRLKTQFSKVEPNLRRRR